MEYSRVALRSLCVRLSIRLFLLYGLGGAVIWQCVSPSAVWPLRLLTGISAGARAIGMVGVMAVGLIVTLTLIQHRVMNPLRALSDYVQRQRVGDCDDDMPIGLRDRQDEIGALATQICQMRSTL